VSDTYVSHEIKSFTNGGVKTPLPRTWDKDTLFSHLLPGTTVALWRDDVLGLDYGPSFADSATVHIKRSLRTIVTFRGQEQSVSSTGFLQRLHDQGALLSVDVKTLYTLYRSATHRTKVAWKDLLDYLVQAKLIGQQEYERLLQSQTDGALVVAVDASTFISLAKTFNIEYTVDQNALRNLLASLGSEANVSNDSLATLAGELGLMVKTDDNLMRNMVSTGEPVILLRKSASPDTAWYGNDILYRIEYENHGGRAARDLLIVDCLPEELSLENLADGSPKVKSTVEVRGARTYVVWEINDTIRERSRGFLTLVCRIAKYRKPGASTNTR